MVPIVLRQLLHAMASALFPAKCLACGRLFEHEATLPPGDLAPPKDRTTVFAREMSLHFCPHCRGQWKPVASPMCSQCGVAFKSRVGSDHLCGRCLDRPAAFDRARAAGIYDGSLRIAIQALKFKGMVPLATLLGNVLLDTLQRHWKTGDIDVVAPVPLHRRRLRQRGFNQAYLLVKGWTLPDHALIARDLLVRTRATPPQTGLDRRQRRNNIKNAFAVHRPGQSSGKRVLLVDDVLTTGATANACAYALIRDGAERVEVLTLARAL